MSALKTFLVYCHDWAEDISDACEFQETDACYAAEEWAKHAERDGRFAEGYPQGLAVTVIDEDGNAVTLRIDTDFSPCFSAYSPLEAA